MKLLKITLIAIFMQMPFLVSAQGNCSDFFKYRRPEIPYEYNDQSSSAMCVTGNNYEFILPLNKGKDYRLKFYAAAIFNNKINFKIIDQSTHQTIIDLPGETYSAEEGSCVLKDFFDEDSNKEVHPYFDFYPVTTTTLKIIIEVLPLQEESSDNPNIKKQLKQNRGCITVVVLDKPTTNSSF